MQTSSRDIVDDGTIRNLLAGLLGTAAGLIGVGTIAATQLLFTYVPFMQELFRHAAYFPLSTAYPS
jgi:hypothetical protein